jgi:hypothetical protein
MSMIEIQAAASRARTLVTDLERSDRDVDRRQVASGVRHELDTILRLAHAELERLREAAEGDRAGKVRNDAPATSQRSAAAITVKTGTARFAILRELLNSRDGLSDLDLQNRLCLNPSTERPRRGELVDAGLVEAAGTKDQAGTPWTVWVVTQAGADVVADRTGSTPVVVTRAGEPRLF